MSEDMIKAMEAALVATFTVERIMVLANEYHAKTISPERFAERTYQILVEHQKQSKPKEMGDRNA